MPSIKLNLHQEVEQIFGKKFQYQKPKAPQAWQLPPDQKQNPHFGEYYQFPALLALKDNLNAVKSKLNDYGVEEWSSHTNRRDPSGEVSWRLKNETKAEFVTVAWCKFFEVLHRYPVVSQPKLNTVHLCEAPGAFIAALNHYLHSKYQKDEIKWNWRSTTLNPYYEGNALTEMITDDRFIFHTLDHWIFHEDLTGNLINVSNIKGMTDRCMKDFAGQEVDLITADGSIDCAQQPESQEEIVQRLFSAEIITALSILKKGGTFVIKMFTLFEACSVSLLYLLNCVFENVNLYKPATSKRGNSEVYVICLDYQKEAPGLARLLEEMLQKLSNPQDAMVMPLFAKADIPKDFLLQHEIGCRLFMKLQVDAIEGSIYAYESNDRVYTQHLHDLRGLVSSMYYNRYKVRPLAEDLCLVSNKASLNKPLGQFVPIYGGSYTERAKIQQGDILHQMYCLRREFNQLEKCPNTNAIVSYKHEPLNGSLRVSWGLPVQQLQSSLFASERVLLLRLRLLDTFEMDPIWQINSKCLLNATDQSGINYQSPEENESFHQGQQKFFANLIEIVLKQKPMTIVFDNFLFLSHYAVSLLLVLGEMIFNEMIINETSINLNGLKQDLDIAEQLLSLLKTETSDGKAIHSFIDIKYLQKNQFSQALIQHNNNLLLACYRSMLGEDSFPRPMANTASVESKTNSSNSNDMVVV
ncbi:uncharacterized protein Dwil_GK22226 [Drosophila willistoni]|uniref:Cap-specific mRNA (nucleoside-2'-O-)-methyltransferase 2 n=1 Tax=Drosophila willistoni TaxID=7260 RepID=B4MYI3_DROWI|nr:cap-specific mRNA (nucleoside-2'-O-)-methyltransferase 2 [Drosophila willistoni]EDW77172.1 uncharacterized protein Dwil_GK22226 [Drosophila willistoni]